MTTYSSFQEVADKVATHLFAQGKPTTNLTGECVYRTMTLSTPPVTLSCAVGCLFSDEEYDPKMEGQDASGIMEFGVIEVLGHTKDDTGYFLNILQAVHDDRSFWKTTPLMMAALRAVYDNFKLDPTHLDTLKFKDR